MANNRESDLIEKAITEAIRTMEDAEDGDILVDWVVVAYVTNPDPEKLSGYPMFFPNGDTPTYRARGLLTTGMTRLADE